MCPASTSPVCPGQRLHGTGPATMPYHSTQGVLVLGVPLLLCSCPPGPPSRMLFLTSVHFPGCPRPRVDGREVDCFSWRSVEVHGTAVPLPQGGRLGSGHCACPSRALCTAPRSPPFLTRDHWLSLTSQHGLVQAWVTLRGAHSPAQPWAPAQVSPWWHVHPSSTNRSRRLRPRDVLT